MLRSFGRCPRYRHGLAAVAALASLIITAPSFAQTAAYASDAPRVLVIPQQETTLVAPAATMVEDMVSGLGSRFKAGVTLIRFDCSLPAARREIAKAEVSAATQNLQAKRRLKELRAAGEVEVALAEAALEKASAELALADVYVAQCRIRAPFAGRLVKQHVRQYQGVQTGDPLIDIVAAGALKLRLNVPSRWLSWLKSGTVFETRIDETERSYQARVTAINARVDAVSQSIEIEAEVVGEHPELLAGMSGVARFAPPR
ncbi:MAG: HlyD family efflux transporter periplasmic adaptor subunit [Burkholderiaceae bacterium]